MHSTNWKSCAHALLRYHVFCAARHGSVGTASSIAEFGEAASGRKQAAGRIDERATVLVSEMESMMSLLVDATHTMPVFTHILHANQQEFKRIEDDLTHLRRQLANDSLLKRVFRVPTRIERLVVVCQASRRAVCSNYQIVGSRLSQPDFWMSDYKSDYDSNRIRVTIYFVNDYRVRVSSLCRRTLAYLRGM